MSPTDKWQQKILDSWRPGTLILTSGSRLARQLRHRYRIQQLETGQNSWRPLEVQSLNSWLHQSWWVLWEDEVPAGSWFRFRLWQEVARRHPPAADLPLDLSLCRTLDETYGVLVRHRLDPTAGTNPAPLLAWRRQLCKEFADALADEKRWHPADLPRRIAVSIQTGRLPLTDSVVLAAFEAPAPLEEDLFQALHQKTRVTEFPLPRATEANIRAVVLPDQEQEVLYLGESLVHLCQQVRPGAIGVVVPNLESYAPSLRKTLEGLLGQSATPSKATHNITLGQPLIDRPLVLAALLPLRLLGEENTRQVLVSLLLSPYYATWTKHRLRLARLDIPWREMDADADLDALFTAAQNIRPELAKYLAPGGNDLRDLLAPFRQGHARSAATWKHLLDGLWSTLQFPVLADEADQIAHRHLKSALASLVADLGSWTMDATTFLAWCRQALSSEIFQVGASEQSGIQIMGLIESRGLAFERLFLLGMISTALPQPVRPLPFLEFEERKQVLGGTLKRQFDFAGSAFAHLLATAPEIIMTRPREVDGEPVTATPFWPEPWDNISASLWHKPDPAWARVAWLRSTWRGLSEPISDDPAPEILATPVPFPESVSVSQLAAAFRCPFRFLIQELLGLKPLAEPTAGLRPEERGQHIHRVLACITRRLRSHLEIGEIEWQRFWSLAGTCVDETLSNLAADPLWLVERRRWLGDKFGLLGQWFSQELGHLEEGWRWVAEEIPFRGLTVEGWPTALSGRIDRLDYHPENGLLCWDYKSGSSPSHSEVFNLLSEPQLPAYLLALLEGLAELPGLPGHQKQKIQAGYISLKAEKDIRFDRLQADADQWRSLLVVWQQRLRELGQQMQRGRFDVDPLPGAPKRRREQLCTYCGLLTICDRKPL